MAPVRTLRFDGVADDGDGDARRWRRRAMTRMMSGYRSSSVDDARAGVRRASSAVRAPAESDDEGEEDARADAEDVGGRSEDSSETIASRLGSETVLAVGRARQDAFERARERRARARATAAKRIASLELELSLARELEAKELESNLELVREMGTRLRAKDEVLMEDVKKIRDARAAAAAAARRETDALVMRAVAADAEAKEAAERARVGRACRRRKRRRRRGRRRRRRREGKRRRRTPRN